MPPFGPAICISKKNTHRLMAVYVLWWTITDSNR